MNDAFEGVAEHMKGLGLAALSHGLQHTFFYDQSNPYWNDLAVLQVAHAAEILIKARISEQHPLLIFSDLPRSTQVGGGGIEHPSIGRVWQNISVPRPSGQTLGYDRIYAP
ncbi:MAG TPA: hypothetical protein VF538_04950 [Pyrinomonadaceae bacterium]|jgi:hypothetical protein